MLSITILTYAFVIVMSISAIHTGIYMPFYNISLSSCECSSLVAKVNNYL